MKNIFKRRKKEKITEPVEIPMEQAVGDSLNKLLGLSGSLAPSTRESLHKYLNDKKPVTAYEFCSNSDIYPLTLVIDHDSIERDKLIHLFNEISGLEIISSEYKEDEKNLLTWRSEGAEVLSGPEEGFFLIKSPLPATNEQDCLHIRANREFFFGSLLAGDLNIKGSPLSISSNRLCFNPETQVGKEASSFRCLMKLGEREIETGLTIEAQSSIANAIAKEIFKKQVADLGVFLEQKSTLLKGSSVGIEEVCQMGDYSLEGEIFTSGGTFPYTLYFPKKLLNAMPEQVCSTIKGKVLQINTMLYKRNFQDFHRSHDNFLFSDLVSHLPGRDLNLICQNFLISSSFRGDNLRALFRFLVRRDEKSIVLRQPFPAEKEFVSRLPAALREEYIKSKAYSPSYSMMLQANEEILIKIYDQFKEGKLLLSPKAQFIMNRETGREMKEGKMLRLKKLMSDKRYLQALNRLDKRRAQVLLGNMNHTWLADTFVYQADQLPLVKPFMSKTRFNELMEDVKFTQKKIKSGQIDISRIGDSMESFNKEVLDFVEKEKEQSQK